MADLSKGNERPSRKREEAGRWRRECRVLEQQALREGRNDTKRKCKLPLFFFYLFAPRSLPLNSCFFFVGAGCTSIRCAFHVVNHTDGERGRDDDLFKVS